MGAYEDYLKKKKATIASSTTQNQSVTTTPTTTQTSKKTVTTPTPAKAPVNSSYQEYLKKKKTIIVEKPKQTPSQVAAVEVKKPVEQLQTKQNIFQKIGTGISNIVENLSGKKKIQDQLGATPLETPKIDTSKITTVTSPIDVMGGANVADQSAMTTITRKNVFDQTISSGLLKVANEMGNNGNNLIDTGISMIQKKIEEKPENYKWLVTAQKFAEDTPFIGLNKSPVSKGITQGVAKTLLGSSRQVQETFDKRLVQPVTWEGKTLQTVGEVVGGILPYLVGGSALKALGAGKAMLPVLFATLGQTSAGPDTTLTQRLEILPIDVLTGYVFSKIPFVKGLGRQAWKSIGLTSSTVGISSFDKALVEGNDIKTSAKIAGISAATAGLFYIAGNATGLLVNERSSTKSTLKSPQEVRDFVNKNKAAETTQGKSLLDLANNAEQLGKNIEFKGTLTKESLLSEVIKGKGNIKGSVTMDYKLVDQPGKVGGPTQKTDSQVIQMTPQAAMDTITASDLNGTPAGEKFMAIAIAAQKTNNLVNVDPTGTIGEKVTTPGNNTIGIEISKNVGIEPPPKAAETTPVETPVSEPVKVENNKKETTPTEIRWPNSYPEKGVKFFASVKGDTAKISAIEISPSKQKQGVGTKYVQEFEKWAKEQGATKIEIDSYKKSTGFWEKMGFTLDKEFPIIGGVKQAFKYGVKEITPTTKEKKIPTYKRLGFIKEYNDMFDGNDYFLKDTKIDIKEAQSKMVELSKKYKFNLKANPDGTIHLFHRTDEKNMVKILNKGFRDEQLFGSPTTKIEYGGVNGAGYYGDHIISFDADPRDLVFRQNGEYYVNHGARVINIKQYQKSKPTEKQTAQAEVAKEIRNNYQPGELSEIAYLKRLRNLKKYSEGDAETLRKVAGTKVTDVIQAVRRVESNLDLSENEALDIAMGVPTKKATSPRSYPMADTGGYSNIESVQKSVENLRSIEFPELLRLYTTLTNKVPVLKVIKSYLGYLKVGEGKDAQMALSYEIFKDPKLAIKVFAHEFGHLTDFFPDKTIKRGNLLGRIASLRGYLKHMLPEKMGGLGVLTDADKKRLMKEARKLSKLPQKEEYEVIIGDQKATPAEILAIWNDTMAGEKMPELMDWIKQLSEQQKISVVKGAIKGVLPEWASFGVEIKEKRIREVIKNAPADIKKKYKELVMEEIKKRRLFQLETVTKELKTLTQVFWKPFDVNMDPAYTKYRFSSKELYADAISVLFNDPALLKEKAPEFFRGFFNYIDSKPEIRDNFFKLQEILNAGDEQVFQERYKALEKDYKTAEDAWLAQEIEKKNTKVNVIGMLNTLFNNKNAVILSKRNAALKKGMIIDPEADPLYDLGGLNYMEGAIKVFVHDNFQPAVTKASEVDNGWSDLGKILQLERAIYERGELANPGGYDPKTAQWTLDKIEKSMDAESWTKLQEAKELFRKGMSVLVDKAEKEGFYRPEMLEIMKANKAYATFQVLDYIDQKVTSKVYQSKGTLKGVANPATTSLMKMVTTLRAMRYNKSKKINLAFIKELGELEPAKTRWNGKAKVPAPPRDNKKELVTAIVNGKIQGYYVDKDVAQILNHTEEPTLRKLGTITKLLTQTKIYRPLFTSLNLGFQLFNFSKDFQRAWRNMPDKTIGQALLSFPKLIANYVKAAPAAWSKAVGTEAEIVREMEVNEIFGLNMNDLYGSPDPGEEEVTRVLRRIGVVPGLEGRSKLKTLLKPITFIFDGIETIGNFIEALPKISGYNMLKANMPKEELANYIRNYIGSPDFLTSGSATPISNNIAIFSNAAKEGIKGDINMSFRPKTRGAWWFKSILGMLPKLIQIAGALGLLGLGYKKMLDSISEYDKTSYNIIPLGIDENGKTIYIRAPMDETGRFQGAMLWKMANLFKGGDKQTLMNNLTDIFSLWSGQLPNLTPSITGLQALSVYLSGNNPWDGFRNRNIIPETTFKAGYKYSFPVMLQWLLNNQGASVVLPAYKSESGMTTLEQILNFPVLSNLLGRFVRVSDYGQQEIDAKIKAEIEQKNAIKTLTRNEVIKNAIEQKRGPNLSDIEKVLGHKLDTNSKDDVQEVSNLMKKYEIENLKGKNVYLDNLIYATSNEAKVQMLQRYQQSLSGQEFYDLLKTASEYKVVSNEALKDFSELKPLEKNDLLNFKLVKEAHAAEGIMGTNKDLTWTKDIRTGWQQFLGAVSKIIPGTQKYENPIEGISEKNLTNFERKKYYETMLAIRQEDTDWYYKNIGNEVEKRILGFDMGSEKDFRAAVEKKAIADKTITGSASFYNPTNPDETKAGGNGIGAYGRKIESGSVAMGNRQFQTDLKKGKMIYIKVEGMEDVTTPYGKGIFRIDDTMNKRYAETNNIDFNAADLNKARKDKGRFNIKYQILTDFNPQ